MQGTEKQAHIRVTGQPWGAGELPSTMMNGNLRSKAYSRTVTHGHVNEALLFRGGTSTDFYLPMPDQSSAPLKAPPINFQTLPDSVLALKFPRQTIERRNHETNRRGIRLASKSATSQRSKPTWAFGSVSDLDCLFRKCLSLMYTIEKVIQRKVVPW